MDREKEFVIYVEFHNGKPWSILVKNEKGHIDEYDVVWSKRDQCYYKSMVGGGGYEVIHVLESSKNRKVSYWVTDGILINNPGNEERLPELPKGYPDVLFDIYDAEHVYCTVCEDWLPEESPCQHLQVVEYEVEWDWHGAGAYSPDGHKKEKQSLQILLGNMETDDVQAIRASMADQNYSFSVGMTPSDPVFLTADLGDRTREISMDKFSNQQIEDMACGIAWLLSLQAQVTAEADKLTIDWIDEWLSLQEAQTAEAAIVE